MPLNGFDHVNLRTVQLDRMIDWYGAVLGLTPGPRPDFPFPGAWLYLGDLAVVHLVGTPDAGRAATAPTLEHFAFRATGFARFRETLTAHGVDHSVDAVPGMPIVQVNFRDPDGNHIHVDFDTAET
jgi:catechol 2,3-dioxygenase-like lactoylglutathione lyase family enzyme